MPPRRLALPPKKDESQLSLGHLTSVTVQDCWQAWVRGICADQSMDRDRVMRHIQDHVNKHMPNADAPQERFAYWLAGQYNLLAILGHMVGCDPPFSLGMDLLFRKWAKAPADHTPPPPEVVEKTEKRPSKKKKAVTPPRERMTDCS